MNSKQPVQIFTAKNLLAFISKMKILVPPLVTVLNMYRLFVKATTYQISVLTCTELNKLTFSNDMNNQVLLYVEAVSKFYVNVSTSITSLQKWVQNLTYLCIFRYFQRYIQIRFRPKETSVNFVPPVPTWSLNTVKTT